MSCDLRVIIICVIFQINNKPGCIVVVTDGLDEAGENALRLEAGVLPILGEPVDQLREEGLEQAAHHRILKT